jgi:hypothetical protein
MDGIFCANGSFAYSAVAIMMKAMFFMNARR